MKLTNYTAYPNLAAVFDSSAKPAADDPGRIWSRPHIKSMGRDWADTPNGVDAADPKALRRAILDRPRYRDDVLRSVDHWNNELGQTEQAVWTTDVAGAFPIVPAYIAGDEMCMRRRTHSVDFTAPVRIYFWSIGNVSISGETLRNYGIELAALALALSAVRPVELYMLWGANDLSSRKTGGVMATVPVDITQLDPGVVGELCGPTLMRLALPSALVGDGRRPGSCWPLDRVPNSENFDTEHLPALREMLGLTDDDIVVPPVFEAPGHGEDPRQRFNDIWKKATNQ